MKMAASSSKINPRKLLPTERASTVVSLIKNVIQVWEWKTLNNGPLLELTDWKWKLDNGEAVPILTDQVHAFFISNAFLQLSLSVV